MTKDLFDSANPAARIDPETCSHSWDPIHNVNEGFDVINCGRCDKVLGIQPMEYPHEHEPPTLVIRDTEAQLLHEHRPTQAEIRHPSRSQAVGTPTPDQVPR